MGDERERGHPAPEQLPLLPRGTTVFTDLPARALVLEALAPAVGSGLLRVRSQHGAGFILVRDGALYETHVFSASGAHATSHALEELRRWPEAVVSADRLDVALVDLSAALLRGETLYDDLRLEWTSWAGLLADLARREAAYIVELSTATGRGVTCVAGGRQLLSYTDVQPALGDPALLEAMASSGAGDIRVRRVAPMTFAGLLQAGAGTPVQWARGGALGGAFPPPDDTAQPPTLATFAQAVAGFTLPVEPSLPAEAPLPVEVRQHDPVDDDTDDEEAAIDLGWVAPWQVAWGVDPPDEPARPGSPLHGLTVGDVHSELREIAQRRLQLSASRVEAALDSAAAQDLPLDRVLEDLRSLSIRGLMQPTIDAMVDEMTEVAGRRVEGI